MARLVRMLATAPNGLAAAVEPDFATPDWLEPALAS